MMKILHVVTHDKFTAGYINFMKMYMKEYKHTFITSARSCSQDETIEGKLVDEDNVIKYSSIYWLAFSREIRMLLKQADKIIVSGIFGVERSMFFWPTSAFEKVYLHYWGGDFYQIREKVPTKKVRERIYRYMLMQCLKKSQGALYLIEGEYEKFREITGIEKKHVHIAAVPSDPLREFDYAQYREEGVTLPLRIVVGNSATEENQQIDIFERLEHLKNEKIEIYCPLSYGDENYAKRVLEEGVRVFGDKFHAITDWMDLHKYYKFLASCHIGVFNNNRQQAMGNIMSMLLLGRKVYLRADTSMYKNYVKQGFLIYDVNELDAISIDELAKFDGRNRNLQVAERLTRMEVIIDGWRKVFAEE